MTIAQPPPSAQRFVSPPTCRHCGTPIRTGTRRPRLFCDRPGCRKAASRRRAGAEFCDIKRAQVRGYQPPKNNSPAVNSVEKGGKNPNEISRIIGQIEWPIDLIGRRQRCSRPGATNLDPVLIQKIFAAEIGVPTASMTSLDGVSATSTPRWRRS
jgi:hypothetical protein